MVRGFLKRLRAWARRLRLELVALGIALRDPRTPLFAKILGAMVLAYALSPIDLIPDFVPVLGYLDDLLLVPLGLWLTLQLVPAQVMLDARACAAQQADAARHPSVVGAVLVVAVWVCAAAVLAAFARRWLDPG